MTIRLVSCDIGGTHARFALAQVSHGGSIALGEAITFETRDYPSFTLALQAFAHLQGTHLPQALAIAIAGPVDANADEGSVIRFTNNPWLIQPGQIAAELALDQITLVNDFAAVGHAVARAGAADFLPLTGQSILLPATGMVSIVGPGTGFGVAQLWRDCSGSYRVHPTEGGHIDFAPVDPVEDAILARLRVRHGRVSVERMVSGPAIIDTYQMLAAMADTPFLPLDDRTIWQRGISGDDPLCVAAVDRFCMSLGSVAGDLALAHGAVGVVVAGGLGLRLRDKLPGSGFAERFCAKGRFEARMAALPVMLLTMPQPGLFGAAAAFAHEHCV
ncbi:MAG: glucokinase [Novosphingobium sp.]